MLWLQDHMCQYVDLEYCKTDLIAAKGVIFCKFHKTSSALAALEDITGTGTVGKKHTLPWSVLVQAGTQA